MPLTVPGGGASVNDNFIVGQNGQNNSDLTNKVIIPGLTASPDIRVAGVNDDEFDSAGLTGWTLLNTPTTSNSNTAALSCAYLKSAATTGDNWRGIYKANPTIPFTVTCKVNDRQCGGGANGAGLFIGLAVPGNMSILAFNGNNDIGLFQYTTPSNFSSTVASNGNYRSTCGYLKFVVNNATSVDAYFSQHGLSFTKLTNFNPGFTIGSVGLCVQSNDSSNPGDGYFDWIRFS